MCVALARPFGGSVSVPLQQQGADLGRSHDAPADDYPISPNRELCALGFANVFTSFCTGSLPGYGSITRSRLAASTGATTQMASLLTGTFILLVTYFLLHLLAALPKCILAVIVIVVVFSILEEAPEDVRFFWKMRAWVDGGLMLLTFVLSLFVGVEVRGARASPSSLGLPHAGAER